jgi:hypothetical protein
MAMNPTDAAAKARENAADERERVAAADKPHYPLPGGIPTKTSVFTNRLRAAHSAEADGGDWHRRHGRGVMEDFATALSAAISAANAADPMTPGQIKPLHDLATQVAEAVASYDVPPDRINPDGSVKSVQRQM